ncbi:ABC transporter permease, partial [Stenotrophomonas maltophilia]|uniref:ABC transporter permease n=1 Tax=Stenotrophomonas maltophilia TaxID=40324 RepID=UPI0013DB6696
LNVFARDVAQVMSVVTQLWFWVTPIVYTRSIVPEQFRLIVDLNPMTPLVGIYQDALLLNAWPSLSALFPSVVVSAFAVFLSFIVNRRASPEL